MKVGNHFKLLPGVNQVDQDQFDQAMRLPAFKGLVDSGVIEVLSREADGDLSKLGGKQAIALVGKTVDRDLLGLWAASEKRGDVIKAISKQLEAVTPDPSKDGEGDEDK